ncbi:UNVERIFIED_ORG: DNA invertase Pin-like site-specific DNA recombinase [Burkholderia sp. 1263]|jgi:DNA invertase Pin-like site-specific DNA recombinase|uniref:recombinase family protein n=1 Tax=Paraburkholderia terricola TaxID=169427 RepID=UPI0028596D86|nr:recombinase family protein [Paraburkholderia terricola]MDR6449964.1 DNA invertase Pin-like site-specific DNA recombinase [Paraburkholderia terricola]
MQQAAVASVSFAGTSAAQYVRMSTDHQQYSIGNQKQAIADFAAARNIAVIATYEDAGKSGVTIRGRPSLLRLLQDVQSGTHAFSVVLVYDVSRWGRFQDVDESAHYEYMCRQAGVQVVYCAEEFASDRGAAASLMKALKRAMAGEYSRELSHKVFVGQCRLARLGFWQGAAPGYGLQRVLVDPAGTVKGLLREREHKSIQTDRVIIAPGGEHEVALIRRIYDWYIHHGVGCRRIADRLNAFGILNAHGRPWNPQLVTDILGNEKYAGTNVYARTSRKLDADWHRNPPSEWARSEGAFPPLIDRATFDAAQTIRTHRTQFLSDEELLSRLGEFVRSSGVVRADEIDRAPALPAGKTYSRRFGSIQNAYARVGYEPDYRGATPEVFRATRSALQRCIEETTDGLVAGGHCVDISADGTAIRVDDELVIRFVARMILHYDRRSPRWRVRWPTYASPDLLVILRLDSAFETPLDVYVFPRGSLVPGDDLSLSIRSGTGEPFDMFRFSDGSILLELAARTNVEAFDGSLSSHSNHRYPGDPDSRPESPDPEQAPAAGDCR